FSSRRRHTIFSRDWSSDVCSSDLGSGTPAVSGSLDYAHESGAYAGVWGTSGDTLAGDEYNVYFGFGGEASGLSYDLNVLTYVYQIGRASCRESECISLLDISSDHV